MMRFGVACFLFQILDDCERIGEQPFDIGGIHRAPLTLAVEGLVRAEKCVIQEMLEAQLLVCEGCRNRTLTRRPSAPSSCSRVHSQSQSPKMKFSRGPCDRDYHNFSVSAEVSLARMTMEATEFWLQSICVLVDPSGERDYLGPGMRADESDRSNRAFDALYRGCRVRRRKRLRLRPAINAGHRTLANSNLFCCEFRHRLHPGGFPGKCNQHGERHA